MKKRPFPRFAHLALFALCLVPLIASCGMSKDEVEREVVSSFQQTINEDARYKDYGMKVTGASLYKSGTHTYDGAVTVTLDGKRHEIALTVTVDGDGIFWKTGLAPFSFLPYDSGKFGRKLEQEFDKALKKDFENLFR